MTGRPGHRTMEMNGGSSVSYLTPCVPLFVLCLLIGLETEGLLHYQGRAGIISIVRWSLRPVIFGVEFSNQGSLNDSRYMASCEKVRKRTARKGQKQSARKVRKLSKTSENG